MSISLRRAAGLSLTATAIAFCSVAAQSPSVTVGGIAYAQYQYQFHSDSSLTPSGHQNNFDVTRAYLNVIGKFGEGIVTRVTIDVDGRKAASNQLSYRLKYAYVAWTPTNSPLTLKLGEIHTPLLDWEEAVWDYRMQGSMPMERGGYVSSSDFGAGVDGTWDKNRFDLQVGIYNGENYSGAPGDQRKDLEGRVSLRVMETDLPGKAGGLRLTAYGQYGKPTTGGKRERYLGVVSYKSKAVTLVGEFAATKDSVTGDGGATAAVANRTGRVISGYGTVKLPNSKAAIIGRVDITDPNTGSGASNDKLTRIIGGVSYQLTPNLRLLAAVDNVSRQGGNYANGFNATRTAGAFIGQFTF
jgi:Gram-negative porin